ncbi:YkgJ family cysteine cluster protein [Ideonella sp. 4Y16]|uniref:YkgJ family cysteine cluster protein n=1 Tax=Ideonella alba TaxID=2824118 RepID=UPI001B389162|nr:YkgJ family cysteine cluster protein [Ideonella alba]MBQ0945873.1 YkgJ family cysteine cluster protein [Ideonella alba]
MSAPDFFRQQQQAFAATLAQQAGAATLASQLLAQAADSFGANVAQQCADEPPLACGRGCATCCTLRVSATAPEVLAVAAFLRAVQPRLLSRGVDLVGQVRAADAATHGLGEAQRVALRQRCPFIAQGVCVIYAVRPLACRGHASHDLRACAEAAAGRRDEVPFSPGHRLVRALVQGALQSALRDAGLAWGAYELNAALLLALDDDATEAAWLAGQDPLSDAALDDVPADEMTRVFDALK